jgi:CHAT domain-containing protein/tetratricopeptide (TPR) repeat protein
MLSSAQTWRQLDSLCYEYGHAKPDSAIILGKKAIEGCIKEKGKNSLEYAVCLYHIAWAYKNKYQYKTADSLYSMAIIIMEKLGKTDTEEYCSMMSNLALMYRNTSRYVESANTYKTVIEAVKKIYGQNHFNYAFQLGNLALTYFFQGYYKEAERLYKESYSIILKELGTDSKDYGDVCTNLAQLYQVQGNYVDAEQYYMETKRVREKLFGKNHKLSAEIYSNLGSLYQIQGKYTEAEALLQQGRNLREKTNGKNSIEYANASNNLGVLYMKMRYYPQAETILKEVANTRYNLFGEQNFYYAISCVNLGILYMNHKNYHKAESLLSKACRVYEKLIGKETPYYINANNNLAKIYFTQKKYEQAEQIFRTNKQLIEKILNKNHLYYSYTLINLGELCLAKNLNQEADSFFYEATNSKQKEIEYNFRNLSETEKEKYFQANVEPLYNDFQWFVIRRYSSNPSVAQQAYNLVIQMKGMILTGHEKIKNRILGSNNDELKKLYIAWKLAKDEYSKAISIRETQKKYSKETMDSLADKSNQLEKKLTLKSEELSATLLQKPIYWQDIQKTLKNKEVAVEIACVKKQDTLIYIALILKNNSVYPEMVILPDGKMMENKYITNYRRSVTTKLTDKESYNIFWKPIADKLKGIKTVYFSPEGVYHQINLATLQNPTTKKYVSDEIQIINVTNTKDILENKKFNAKNSYLIGNPKFNLGIDTRDNEKPAEQRSIENLSQLEGAEKEVKEISAIMPSSKATIGAEATEEYIKSIKNPRILHIATHGYFKKGQYQSSTQAMLNAGLLFAGVVDYDRMDIRPYDKEDGKLTAFEVMNMELDSTELVVLSACETGLGQASKEGVYGLQRAFKVAGAQTIIMSLWKVNDEATQLLMTKFYENWQKKGMNKRKAFESAQKDLRKQYKEPYYWGAFVMIE